MASHLSLVTLGLVGYDLTERGLFFQKTRDARHCHSVLVVSCWRGEEGGAQGGHGCIGVPETPLPVGENRPGGCARCWKTCLGGPCRGKRRSRRQIRGDTVQQTLFNYEAGHTCGDRVKIKSDKATYEVVDVRVLRSPEGAMPDLLTHHPSLRGGETRSLNGLPETLALNIAAPCRRRSISGWRPASPCWILLLVLKIADHARAIATDEPDVSKWPPGFRLCRRWLRDAQNDPYFSLG